jgi:hypothetical protein
MTVTEKYIYDYLVSHKMGYLKNGFLLLVNSSFLSGQTFKKMKEFIKENNSPGLENHLIKFFDKYSIPYQLKKYKYEDKSNPLRQKKYQDNLKSLGFKTLSFSVSAPDYKKFLSLKKKKNLKNNELFSLFLK